MLTGALHIHSTYSDGEFTLVELRALFLDAGCRFACVTDHADFFDDAKLRAYVDECRTLSDDGFFFIAGLEYSCRERMHILGYGLTTLIPSDDPETVIAAIGSAGGLSVLAHPRTDHFPAIERFTRLPAGIEVWNTKYDGRYAPRPGTFAMLGRLRARKPDLFAFYGTDLHWRKQYRGMMTVVQTGDPTREAVLEALGRGAFHGVKDAVYLPSDGMLQDDMLRYFAATHAGSTWLRGRLRGAKRLLDRLGIVVPDRVKAQLRRLF